MVKVLPAIAIGPPEAGLVEAELRKLFGKEGNRLRLTGLEGDRLLHMHAFEGRNRLRVVSAHTDCDRDTLLLRVEVEGAGVVCHRGTRSCFTEPVSQRVSETTALPKETR